MPLLELRNVTRRFGSLVAAADVSLAIEAGEFFTLLGPSGCGKTTLLRMIAGFDAPDAGAIFLDGRDLAGTPPERRPVHTVFQSYALFPHMTVAANVAFPLKMAGETPARIAGRVTEALAAVRLEDKNDALPAALSGGQKQRVALARALVNRPRLLLLDEPLGALDAKLREEMQIELIRLQREVGITFVFVTHSQPEALALSHRIAVMDRGRIEQVDTPAQIYSAPLNRFVAGFIGKCTLLPARVEAVANGESTLSVEGLGDVRLRADPQTAGTPGTFALRPEQVAIRRVGEGAGAGANRATGVVRELLYSGDVTTYIVELASGVRIEALAANATPRSALAIGSEVVLDWPVEAGLFLVR